VCGGLDCSPATIISATLMVGPVTGLWNSKSRSWRPRRVWNGIGHLDELALPEDDRNIIVTVHYYEPFPFTHQSAPWMKETVHLSGVNWSTAAPSCSASSAPTTKARWTRALDTQGMSPAPRNPWAGFGRIGSLTRTSSSTISTETAGWSRSSERLFLERMTF